ncbi:isochorismatase family protein [Hymenobacter arizonensis]|uniref:Nicotinamidase-related amidase n=1 Tax=Hymenobacter arizonensis TaxID=1227077 RepID=A0A1I6BJQ7_HYMAR|nr:isochorismatase family protein [Hymenobacter arizonensis]SFQ81169.1 Nicotinamidase-related amidase [Hymenobacter arizonensis]
MKNRLLFSALLLTSSLTTLPAAWAGDPHPKKMPPKAAAATPPNYLEKLTPQNSVLVMVDFLTGFDPGLKTIDKSLYNNNVTALAKLGKLFKLPTLVIGDEGGFRGKFYPALAQYLPDAPRIERHTVSAWQEPKFVEAVKKTGRKKLILAGISIDNCTTHLALDALKAGYEVYVVTDCSGSNEKLVEEAAMMRLTQAGAVMTSWVSLGSELLGDWKKPEGATLGQIYQEHSAWGGFYSGYTAEVGKK